MHYTLECEHISKSFGPVTALQDVSLRARSGSLTALLGPSGCGKTTLLRLVAGFDQPDGGTIRINGQSVASRDFTLPPEKRRVGMVFQEYALFQHMTVEQNIAFGLRGDQPEKTQRVAEMLALVGLPGYERRMPHELSGGQQQRVALARALAPQPAILLLDEPFSNLDTALRTQVRTEIKSILRTNGTTCIFVTHDQEEALSLADEVAIMLDGHIRQMAPPHQLYHHPVDQAVAAFVGESNFLPGHASGTTAECVLGQVPLQQPASGPVELLIRPENLRLENLRLETHQPAAANGAAQGQVIWQEFYGHDQRIGIRLHNDLQLIARLGPLDYFEPHQPVTLSVERPVLAFPVRPG